MHHTKKGVVYQARDKRTGDVRALKRCLPHRESSDGFPITTLREISILRELGAAGGEEYGIIGLRDVTVSSRCVGYTTTLCFFLCVVCTFALVALW